LHAAVGSSWRISRGKQLSIPANTSVHGFSWIDTTWD
jgi:hypothetical protein